MRYPIMCDWHASFCFYSSQRTIQSKPVYLAAFCLRAKSQSPIVNDAVMMLSSKDEPDTVEQFRHRQGCLSRKQRLGRQSRCTGSGRTLISQDVYGEYGNAP